MNEERESGDRWKNIELSNIKDATLSNGKLI